MNWKSIVKSIAPAIGSALGGPLGGAALTALSQALLPEDKQAELQGKPKQIEQAIEQAVLGASPEVLAKIKEADRDFEQKLAELGIDLERIHQADRESARQREIATGSKATPILAGLVIGGFLGMVAYLLTKGTPQGVSAGLIGTVIGYVSAKADQAVSYYFGSSSGSAEKNLLLRRFAKN